MQRVSYYRRCVCVCVCACVHACVCVFGTGVSPTKTAELIEMPFGNRLAWARGTAYQIVVTLAPAGKYDGLICVVAAMWPLATITVVTCYCRHYIVDEVQPAMSKN